MPTKTRLYYEKTKSRSSNFLGLTLEGLRRNRALNSDCSYFDYLTSRKLRINWTHRFF